MTPWCRMGVIVCAKPEFQNVYYLYGVPTLFPCCVWVLAFKVSARFGKSLCSCVKPGPEPSKEGIPLCKPKFLFSWPPPPTPPGCLSGFNWTAIYWYLETWFTSLYVINDFVGVHFNFSQTTTIRVLYSNTTANSNQGCPVDQHVRLKFPVFDRERLERSKNLGLNGHRTGIVMPLPHVPNPFNKVCSLIISNETVHVVKKLELCRNTVSAELSPFWIPGRKNDAVRAYNWSEVKGQKIEQNEKFRLELIRDSEFYVLLVPEALSSKNLYYLFFFLQKVWLN